MRGAQQHCMRWPAADRIRRGLLRLACLRAICVRLVGVALFLTAGFTAALAQEPPLTVPKGGISKPGDALTAGDWILYPSVRGYSLYSDNLFQTPTNPISVWGFGVAPSLIAEWSHGIHQTTLYGNADLRSYPTRNDLNMSDRQAGFVQRYDPLRDLTFRIQGDYTHQTNASANSAIPGGIASPGTTVLPNGNIVLPDGTIVNPGGQTVGHTTAPVSVANSTTTINPNDQFTGTASVEKILNRGFIGLTGALSRTEYQNTSLAPDFTAKTLTGKGSVWLGPVFFAYADGALSSQTTTTQQTTTAYTAKGGVGTRQIGLFRASAYFGHQGSTIEDSAAAGFAPQGSSTAGGDIYGARFSYYPTPGWTVSLGVDEIINISSQTGVTNLVLNLPIPTPLVVPLSASTRVTAYSLETGYEISRQWSALGHFGYTRVEYIDTSRLDNAWLADAMLAYKMRRNLTLTWEYQYAAVVSNAPLTSSKRNYVNMSSNYNF